MDDAALLVDPEYGEVLDTKREFLVQLQKKAVKVILFALFSLVWGCLWIIFIPDILSSLFGFIVFILPGSFFVIWLCTIYAKIREAFWRQLALKYKWEYTASKDISKEKALLFKVGDSASAAHGINGSYNGQPFHIFEYEYTIGTGKNKQTFSFTVFEVKFSGTFPHLYLNYKKDWYSNTPPLFSSLAKISVPEEFEKKFKLYAPKEYEIETLEIFTPDVFAALLDLKWNHDMEFVDGELVIYRKAKFSNFKSLDAELDKIKKFVDILSPLLNRLKLTQIGDISPMLKN